MISIKNNIISNKIVEIIENTIIKILYSLIALIILIIIILIINNSSNSSWSLLDANYLINSLKTLSKINIIEIIKTYLSFKFDTGIVLCDGGEIDFTPDVVRYNITYNDLFHIKLSYLHSDSYNSLKQLCLDNGYTKAKNWELFIPEINNKSKLKDIAVRTIESDLDIFSISKLWPEEGLHLIFDYKYAEKLDIYKSITTTKFKYLLNI
jgi:hypothetical protein